MLTIRMQRVGRKGHAQFRMVVQDSRFHPSSGRVVAYLGSYDPHSKRSQFDREKLQTYLTNGAQPSPRVVKLLKQEKVKLPAWVSLPPEKKKTVRNPEKRRSTAPEKPAEESTAADAPEAAAEAITEASPEPPVEQGTEAPTEGAPAAESPAESSAEVTPTAQDPDAQGEESTQATAGASAEPSEKP